MNAMGRTSGDEATYATQASPQAIREKGKFKIFVPDSLNVLKILIFLLI